MSQTVVKSKTVSYGLIEIVKVFGKDEWWIRINGKLDGCCFSSLDSARRKFDALT